MISSKLTRVGSAAAAAQSSMGEVATHGLFATMQSAAAGGYGAAIVNGAVQGAGAAGYAVDWMLGRR